MNKKLMTMLVACALSVTTLSTTAVFAEDAVVTGETPAVTETTTTPETTPADFYPGVTLLTPKKWTGDSDIVFEVDAKGGTVSNGEFYIYDTDGLGEPLEVQNKIEVNEEGKGKITFTKDALMNAKTWSWDDDEEVGNQIKAPAPTVTPTTPAKPSTPAKPAENKGITTITPNAPAAKDDKKTNTTTTTTTTKKEAPKTGDTMNAALYASLLVVSALAAVVLATKKKVTE